MTRNRVVQRSHAAAGAESLRNNVARGTDDSPEKAGVTTMTSDGTGARDRSVDLGAATIGSRTITVDRTRAVLADVAELGPFFTVGTDPAPAGGGWRPMHELYTDPEPLAARIAHVRRALDSDQRVAASIAFQGLVALVLSAPFAAVVLHGVLPRLTSRSLHWRADDRGPWPLHCPGPVGDPVGAPADGAAALAALLVDDHLVPLIAAVRAQVAISERVLWGNVASSVASGKRLVGSARPALARRAALVAERLLATGPLAGTGDRVAAIDPDRGWTFRRRSCCLYYRVRDGGLCGDCILLAMGPRAVG
jgi:FhuF 2Fe-2S C-terminal domain